MSEGSSVLKRLESTWRRLQKPGFGVFGIVRVCFLYTSHEKVLQRASESIFGVSESIFYTLHM